MHHVKLTNLGEKSSHGIVSPVVDATSPVVAPLDHCARLFGEKGDAQNLGDKGRTRACLKNVRAHFVETVVHLRLWSRPEAEAEHKLVLSRSQERLLVFDKSGQ